jgi:phosphoribosylamine--glycine ligase
MVVLVVGQGGREHALVRALSSSPSVQKVHALPGSDGMSHEAICHDLPWQDFEKVATLVQKQGIDLVVIGPEVPLAGGLSDALRAKQIAVVGPSQEAAQLESSKIYSKEFMVEAGVPTARFEIVASVSETMKAAKQFAPPYVLKADGLAAGKGVFICKTLPELESAARDLFEARVLGEAGNRALLEEFQAGYEISYLVLTNGEGHETLVLAQDHKRLHDGDEGPNTGGMGVVAPVAIDDELRERIEVEVIRPSIAHLKKRGLLYRGVLYAGLMITPKGPNTIEFNARFGDPEAQVILPLLDGDWGTVLKDLAEGRMQSLKWKKASAACIVLAAEGYPDDPVKGSPIDGLTRSADGNDAYVLHAGAKLDSKQIWVTSGGRVLNAVGFGATLKEALAAAYRVASGIKWKGQQVRKDIGAKLL